MQSIGKVFGAIGRGMRSRAIEKISREDPVLGARIKKLDMDRKAMIKHLQIVLMWVLAKILLVYP